MPNDSFDKMPENFWDAILNRKMQEAFGNLLKQPCTTKSLSEKFSTYSQLYEFIANNEPKGGHAALMDLISKKIAAHMENISNHTSAKKMEFQNECYEELAKKITEYTMKLQEGISVVEKLHKTKTNEWGEKSALGKYSRMMPQFGEEIQDQKAELADLQQRIKQYIPGRTAYKQFSTCKDYLSKFSALKNSSGVSVKTVIKAATKSEGPHIPEPRNKSKPPSFKS